MQDTYSKSSEAALPDAKHATPSGATRLEFIDGLRGCAILAVVCGHFYLRTYDKGFPRWADVIGLSYLGVHLFLLLSGFCIAWAYLGPRHRPMELKDFAARRAGRILPAYYAALLISLLIVQPYLKGDLLRQVITHATMTHNLFRDTVTAINGPFWSLALECQLYCAFPILLWAVRRKGWAVMLGTTLAVQLVFRIWAMRFGTINNAYTYTVQWSVLGRLMEFALGMAAASLVAQGKTLWHERAKWGLPICLGLAYLSKSKLGMTHPVTDLLWSMGFWCLVLRASVSPLLQTVLSGKLLAGIGVTSYSIYLVHELIMGHVTIGAFALTGNHLPPIVLLPFVVGVTLLACMPFYFLVEKPSIVFFANRRRKAVSVAQQPQMAPAAE